jgi:hypothetical protein
VARLFAVDPPEGTQVTLPAELLEADVIFKYEVIAIEARTYDEVERGGRRPSRHRRVCTPPSPG